MDDSGTTKGINTPDSPRKLFIARGLMLVSLVALAGAAMLLVFVPFQVPGLESLPWSLCLPTLISLGFVSMLIARVLQPGNLLVGKRAVVVRYVFIVGLLVVAVVSIFLFRSLLKLALDMPNQHLDHPTLAIIVAILALAVQVGFIVVAPYVAWTVWRKLQGKGSAGTPNGPVSPEE